MIPHALMLIILLSCNGSSIESQEELEERCMPVLTEILNIQHHRDIARKDFELTLSDYENGRLSEEIWQNEKSVWLERESQLAGDVNRLYIYSYETRCLE